MCLVGNNLHFLVAFSCAVGLGYVHISLLVAQELLDTLAFSAPVPVDMLAGRLDADEAGAAGGVVVESGSACWAWA